jgi:hypothetical protein
MKRQAATGDVSSERINGWLTISSGMFGLVAIGCLLAAVTTRTTWNPSGRAYLLFRAHDVGVTLQFLLLIPLVVELKKGRQGITPAMNSRLIVLGIGSITLVALFLILGIWGAVNDMSYMLPQGVFGAWLLVMNVLFSRFLPRWLRVFGVVVALGLLSVGTVFPGLATFVYPNMWKIPAVSVENETFVHSGINRELHLVLAIGSLLGVFTLPAWTLLIGSNLLAKRRSDAKDPLSN